MEAILETQRVYKEIGSPVELVNLIDNPPLFAYQADIKCRFYSNSEPNVDCRVYVFDRAFLIARKKCDIDVNKNSKPVILADTVKNANDQVSAKKALQKLKEVENIQKALFARQNQDIKPEEDNSEFCLEFYACLGQTYPTFFNKAKEETYALEFTQISNREGKAEDAIIVDKVVFYIDHSFSEAIAVIGGLLQENITNLFRIPQSKGYDNKSMRKSRTLNRSNRTKSRTQGRASKQREVEKLRQQMRKNTTDSSRRRGKTEDITEADKAEEMDEAGSYIVVFGEHCLNRGLSVSDKGLVNEVPMWTLADAAGVCVGDKVEMLRGEDVVNGKVENLDFPEPLEMVFSRTRAEEIKHAKRQDGFKSDGSGGRVSFDKDDSQTVEVFFARRKKKVKKFADDFESDEEEENEEKEKEKENLNEFQPVNEKGARRRLNDKAKIWSRMRKGFKIDMRGAVIDLEMEVFVEEKKYVEKLFVRLIDSLETKKEKNCVRALEEIYTTEVKYLEHLNLLVEARLTISRLKRNLSCKESKSGKIFCEHKKVRKLCNLQSRNLEQAVSNEDLDKVFLNMKSIISVHQQIEKGLRKKMCKLYTNMLQDRVVTVEDILCIFCNEFTNVAPYLSMYTNYIQRYSTAVEAQKTLRHKNTHFNIGLTKVEEDNGMRFLSLLNKPLQRVTKYPLLFQALEAYVKKFIKQEEGDNKPEADEKFASLAFALENASKKVKEVVEKVNKKVGKAKDLEEMTRIYEEIGGINKIEDLLQPWRQYRGEFSLCRYSFGSDMGDVNELEESTLFVFSDMVVAACQNTKDRANSIASVGMSSVARRASRKIGKIGSTLSRSSMGLMISSAKNKVADSGSRLARFKGKNKGKKGPKLVKQNKSRRGLAGIKKNLKIDHYNNKGIQKGNTKPKKFGLDRTLKRQGSRRGSNTSSQKSSAKKRTARKTKNGEKEGKFRDLAPEAQIKINYLRGAEFTEECEEDDDEVLFAVTYDYDEPKRNADGEDSGMDSDDETRLKLFFKTDEARTKVTTLIVQIQEEMKEKRREWEKVRVKAKGEVLPNTNIPTDVTKTI